MIRDAIKNHYIGMDSGFRFRGTEQTRIETFSDAVFALAVTLLLISSQPPSTFQELKVFTAELIPFAMCITLIGLIWFQHFMFFFRYGFINAYIVFLNIALLFTVLFYVYPLKFLTKLLSVQIIALFTGMNQQRLKEMEGMINWTDSGLLMMIYGIGVVSVFLILALMYRYASKKADELELNEIERFDTRTGIYTNLLMALIPFLSAMIALILIKSYWAGFYSGMVYVLYFPVMFIYGYKRGKRRKALQEKFA